MEDMCEEVRGKRLWTSEDVEVSLEAEFAFSV